jgi:hypothetical protein
MVFSGEWVEKAAEVPPESASPNEANTSSDVLSSEKERCSGQGAFPERSQFSPSDEADDRITKRNEANGMIGGMGRESRRDRPRIGFAKRTH